MVKKMVKDSREWLKNSPRIQYITRSLSFAPSRKMLVILCVVVSGLKNDRLANYTFVLAKLIDDAGLG